MIKKQTVYNKEWSKRQIEKGMCIFCKNPHLKNQKTCCKCFMKNLSHRLTGNRKLHEALYGKLIQQDYKCYLTGEELELGTNASIDHVIPISENPALKDEIDNLRWCTIEINRMKTNISTERFFELCKMVVNMEKK